MPRTLFVLPDGTLAYIRPENSARQYFEDNDKEKKNFLPIEGWIQNQQIKELCDPSQITSLPRSSGSIYNYQYKTKLNASQQASLRNLMIKALPGQLRGLLPAIVQNPKNIRMFDSRHQMQIDSFEQKIAGAKIETLQKWGYWGGVYFSRVTPHLDEKRCVSDEKNVNTLKLDEAESFLKHMRQPFAHDLHATKEELLKTQKGMIISSLFPKVAGAHFKDMNYIERLRKAILQGIEYGQIDSDGQLHIFQKVILSEREIPNVPSDTNLVIIQDIAFDSGFVSFLERMNFPFEKSPVTFRLLHAQQFLQKFGFTTIPGYREDEKCPNIKGQRTTGKFQGEWSVDKIKKKLTAIVKKVKSITNTRQLNDYLSNEAKFLNDVKIFASQAHSIANSDLWIKAIEAMRSRNRDRILQIEI